MKLSTIKAISHRVEQGEWRDDFVMFEGLRLKLRGAGNSDWIRVKARLAVERAKLTLTSPEDIAARDIEERRIVIRDAGLIDWNLTEDDGTPIPFSKEKADEFLRDPYIVDMIEMACLAISLGRRENQDRAAKN